MTDSVPAIAIGEVAAALERGAVLVDVREQDEWDLGHAPQARHIPMHEVPDRISEFLDAEDVLVICRQGGRSIQIARYLNHCGYPATQVNGGMVAWQHDGLPVVTPTDQPGRIY